MTEVPDTVTIRVVMTGTQHPERPVQHAGLQLPCVI
jgi:hypothetical protein